LDDLLDERGARVSPTTASSSSRSSATASAGSGSWRATTTPRR